MFEGIGKAVAKQILDSSRMVLFTLSEQLNLPSQIVDYNKQPIVILGALKAKIRSTGWESHNATFLITESRTRCILGLDLHNKVCIILPKNRLQNESLELTYSCVNSRKSEKKSFMQYSKTCSTVKDDQYIIW